MKKLLAIFCCYFISFNAIAADIYKLDPDHTNITWIANHFGFSSPSGKFTKVDGTLILDEQNPFQSSIEVTIDTASIMSGIANLDNHLKSEDFFNVAKFPKAKFVSSGIKTTGSRTAKINGSLTLLGVTKQITLDARLNKIGINPISQKKTAGFTAAAIIKRSDFNMLYGIPGIADNVKINIEAEAIFSAKQEASPTEEKPADTKNSGYVKNPGWNIVDSQVTFETKQKGSSIKGKFGAARGNIAFNKLQQTGNKIDIELDTSTVYMDFSEGLATLKSDPWLAIQKFPKAHFVAQDFKLINNQVTLGLSSKHIEEATIHVNGMLTIKDKTLPVSFDFKFTEDQKNKLASQSLDANLQKGPDEAVAKGSFTINRKDFGIGSNSSDVDDQVLVSFTVKAQKN